MRALAGILFLAGVADARVIEADIRHLCPRGKTWSTVAQCLGRHGKPRVVKTLGNAKLVKLAATEDSGWRMPGLYLYTQLGNEWRLTGMVHGDQWQHVSLQNVKHRTFQGWRLDVKRAESDTQLSTEGTSTMLRMTMSVFCGAMLPCSTALTSCDFYINGKAHWTFRGTLEMGDGVVHVRGDRSKSGGECAQEEDVVLPEPPEPLLE